MDVSSCGVMGPRRSLSGDEVGTAISERTRWRSHRGKQSSPLHMLAPVHLRVCVCMCVLACWADPRNQVERKGVEA
jgi:hypothetical protein